MTRPFGARRAACALLLLSGLLGNPAVAAGQSVLDAVQADAPAHIAFVEGSAVLERDGRPDNSPANMPLLAGDRVRTQAGRVEILFADGSTLHLDANTTVDFQSDELVRLLDGRVRLAIPGPDRDVSYRVDAPSAWAQITQPGEYRVAILRGDREPEVELAVIRGTAELVNEGGRTALRAGERAFSRANAAPSYAYAFNSAMWDEFDRWSESRRDERRGVSAQYLPNEVRPYSASFDRYGSWQHEASYGYVWYPTVSVGWRPYYHGRWATLRPYGWTWIGSDPWAWPTHHYGRWGFSAGLWFWIPGRSWGPAWVSWAYAPGYVSWCPLGWNNRPIFGVNFYGGGHNPWRAWTVVPRHHFGHGYVHARVVHGDRFDARTRGSFVAQNTAPASSRVRRAARVRADSHRRHPVHPARDRPRSTRTWSPGPRASAPRRHAPWSGRPEVRWRSASPGQSRAVPRGSATEFGVPAAGADSSGVSSARSRAVPRAGATEFGVPAASADSAGGRSRAVPRGGATEYGVPGATDSRSRTAYSGQSPSTAPPSQERYAPADRGPRAIPRADSAYRGSVSPSQRQPDSTIQRSDPPAGSRAVPRSGDSAPPNYRRDSYRAPVTGARSRSVARDAPVGARELAAVRARVPSESPQPLRRRCGPQRPGAILRWAVRFVGGFVPPEIRRPVLVRHGPAARRRTEVGRRRSQSPSVARQVSARALAGPRP